jgi:hypothetical protein
MPKVKSTRRTSKPGQIGVFKDYNGKYRATIWVNGKTKNLGSYATTKLAALVYDKEAIKAGRPLDKLNYPKEAPVGYKPIQKALASNNTIGYRGVYRKRKMFYARIAIGGEHITLGTYETAKEAALVHDRAVLKANQSTALLNFPDIVHNLDVEPIRKKKKVRSNNTVGYQGVSAITNNHGKPTGKFVAQIYHGKKMRLGTYNTALEAAHAYDEAAIKVGRQSHTLNFPDDEAGAIVVQKKKKKKKTKKKFPMIRK